MTDTYRYSHFQELFIIPMNEIYLFHIFMYNISHVSADRKERTELDPKFSFCSHKPLAFLCS